MDINDYLCAFPSVTNGIAGAIFFGHKLDPVWHELLHLWKTFLAC